jgi:hypothetical protein
MAQFESLTEEQEKELHEALVDHITSNLTFTELIDIVASTLVNEEVDRQLQEYD